jgi:hypothetical protein
MLHAVEQHAVTEALAGARLRQVVGNVRHRLHPARDDAAMIAGLDRLRRQHHRLETAAADLVDRHGADLVGDPGTALRLAGRVLAEPRLQHVAHDHFLDGIGLHPGAAHGLPDRDRAQLGRALGGE